MTGFQEQVRPGIDRIQPYVPGLTDDELRSLYGLKRVIKLNANENALGPSPLALKAIERELAVLHHYPDGTSRFLRDEIAEFHQVTVGQVLVGNGSDDIIKLLSETFLNPGDEVVVPTPSFSQYNFGAAVMQAKVVQVPLGPGFEYDVQALANAVTERTKLLYLCSPNNPTGTYLRHVDALWLLERLPAHVIVIADLAYNDFSYKADRLIETPELLNDRRIVALHTFSKLYGLAGLRVGYGLAHPDLWSYVHRVREPFNVNRVAQRAAAAALKDVEHVAASQQLVYQSREQFLSWASNRGIEAISPEGNFILIQTGDARQTTERLMERGVMVRAGFAGLDEYVRITFGTLEENDFCLKQLDAVLSETATV
jgi:histidinol-phosphate aminotransferase